MLYIEKFSFGTRRVNGTEIAFRTAGSGRRCCFFTVIRRPM